LYRVALLISRSPASDFRPAGRASRAGLRDPDLAECFEENPRVSVVVFRTVGGERGIDVKNLTRRRRMVFAAITALGLVLAVSTPSQAAGMGGGGGGHGGGGGGGGGGHGGGGGGGGGHGGGSFGGGHGGGGGEHGGGGGGHGFEGHGSDGHHFEGHDHDGHHFEGRDFDDRFGFGFGFGPFFPYYDPYYAAPSYGYYCPSAQAYYPSVSSCPEAWVPVPQ
jgi:hypothetical protein